MSGNPLSNLTQRRVSIEASSLILGDTVAADPTPAAPVVAPEPVAEPVVATPEPAAVVPEPVAPAPAAAAPPKAKPAAKAQSLAKVGEVTIAPATEPSNEMTPFDELEAEYLGRVTDKTALNVRVPKELFRLVNERSLTSKLRGIPLSKDAIVTHALQLYFRLAQTKAQN